MSTPIPPPLTPEQRALLNSLLVSEKQDAALTAALARLDALEEERRLMLTSVKAQDPTETRPTP